MAESLANVINREPAWEALPSAVPSYVRQSLRVCLRKSLRERIPDMGAVRLALDGAFDTAAPQTTPAATLPPRLLWQRELPVAGTALATALVAVLAAWRLWPAVAPVPVSRFTSIVPDGQTLRDTGRSVLAVSPDGRQFVCDTTDGLALRSLDALEAHVIPGTESTLSDPFFSPDGQSACRGGQSACCEPPKGGGCGAAPPSGGFSALSSQESFVSTHGTP